MSAFDVQAKLVRYKAEAAEGADLVRQLSSQASQGEHSLTVEKLQQQLQTQKVRHLNPLQPHLISTQLLASAN